MAEKNIYPQIPSTVWWGVRAILNRSPNATIDERFLGVQLQVQEAAAKAYIKELRSVGIISEEGKATDIARKWRLDDTYAQAVEEIVRSNYPEGLIDVAPLGQADRQKVISWFQREGLGQGSAGNKAATYLLISSQTPNEAPRSGPKSATTETSSRARSVRTPARRPSQPAAATDHEAADKRVVVPRSGGTPETFPLNINIQIHISADAGTDQIDSIFQAMRRYLYDAPDT